MHSFCEIWDKVEFGKSGQPSEASVQWRPGKNDPGCPGLSVTWGCCSLGEKKVKRWNFYSLHRFIQHRIQRIFIPEGVSETNRYWIKITGSFCLNLTNLAGSTRQTNKQTPPINKHKTSTAGQVTVNIKSVQIRNDICSLWKLPLYVSAGNRIRRSWRIIRVNTVFFLGHRLTEKWHTDLLLLSMDAQP